MRDGAACPGAPGPGMAPRPRLARFGDAMRRRRGLIVAIQWGVVVFYLGLLIAPACLPLPPEQAHLYDNLRLFAQFLFWGLWWPFVMLATMLMGRVWCGVFCPEGSLSELASRHGLGRAIPRWIRWRGWPFAAFVGTTLYGQLISVYEYPQAALLMLGGSSVAAVLVGLVYGRGARVWCRYLCPANGVFSLLAKIAPLYFRVDEAEWQRNTAPRPRVNCAPLIDIRHMKSASACHACGRCSGQRGAVRLAWRWPGAEIVGARNQDVRTEEALTLTLGVIGIASAAFLWSSSPLLVALKTRAADWLIERDAFALLADDAPWWLLTHYPAANDVFTWLDGLCILAYILGGGLALGSAVLACVWLAARAARPAGLSWQRLALALVPIAGTGIFLGLSMLTLSHLKAERIGLDWVAPVRLALLVAGSAFSAWLGWKLIGPARAPRAALAFALYALALALIDLVWSYHFFA
jgi:polyferredoxin